MSGLSSQNDDLRLLVIGAVVLVVLAIFGLSFLADGTIGGGSGSHPDVKLLVRIDDDEGNLRYQKKRLVGYQAMLFAGRKREEAERAETVLATEIERLTENAADLALKVADGKEDLAEVEKRFCDERRVARRLLWAGMIGRPLTASDLLTAGRFDEARITKVDATGLRIRHRTGSGRIPVERLSLELRETLDLSIAEARQAILELYLKDARLKAAMSKDRSRKPERPTPEDLEAALQEAIAAQQVRVVELQNLIRLSEEEIRRARHQDANSSNRSVPASLETWKERERRYRSALGSYRKSLDAALVEGRELDPGFMAEDR